MTSQNTASGPLARLSRRNIIAVVLVAVAAIFILQNRNSTTIQLFWVSLQAPLWIVLLAVFLIGWGAGVLTTRRTKNNR